MRDVVSEVADLARLALYEEQKQTLGPDLDKILGYVHAIAEADIDHLEPLIHMTEGATPRRIDSVLSSDELDEFRDKFLMARAPETSGRFIKVPKMAK